MAVPARVTFIPAPWANSAQTSIPVPPVKGIGYRNTALSTSVIQAGQLYGSIGDSSAWNQYLWQLSNVAQACEVYGIAPYNGLTTYKNRSLCLYTDELIYRAKMDVPTGTPCTNATYWEQYIPDGVQIAPPITATAGVTLYVDYTKSVSGDGLTAATAFRNFTDCFTAIRVKFAAANGAFASYSWIPLFTIVATGYTSNTIEAGDWRFQSLNLEIKFNRAFTLNSGVFMQGCVVKFSGTGSFTINKNLTLDTTTFTSAVTLYTNNGVSPTDKNYDEGRAMSIRNSNVTFEAGYTATLRGTQCLQTSGAFINVFGNMTARYTSTGQGGFYMVGSDMYIGGSVEIDAATNGTIAEVTSSVVQSVIRVGSGASLAIRYIELIGSTITNLGVFYTGSRVSNRPAYGIVLRGSYFYNISPGTLGQLGSYDPVNKGAATVGGNVEAPGLAQNSWPGTVGWTIYGNGYYTSGG